MEKLSVEEQLELYDSSPVVVYTCVPEGDFGATYVGKGVTAQLGWSPADFIGDPGFWAAHIHPDDKERVFDGLSVLFENGHYSHEYRFQHKNGSYLWMRDTLRLERDASGTPTRMVGYWMDISAQKTAEEKGHESEARFRSIFENMAETYYRTGLDGRVVMVSPAVEELLGYSVDEAIGMELASLYVDSLGREKFLAELANANGSVRDYQAELQRKDGGTVWVSTNARLVRNNAGNTAGVEGTVRDITARRRAEEELKTAQTRLIDAIESIPDAFALYDADDRLVLHNRRYLEVYPRHADRLAIGERFEDMLREGVSRGEFAEAIGREEEWIADRMRRHAKPEGPVEQRLANGNWLRVEERRTSDGGTVGLRTDITELKVAEQRLKESEERFRDFAESAADWFWEMDEELRFTYMSDSVKRIVGARPEWHYGKTRRDLLGDDYDHDVWDQHFADLNAHRPFRNFEYFRPGDEKIDGIWVRASGTPIFDETGAFAGYRGSSSDITEQKLAEEKLRANEEELARAQKMRAVGQLTGGVAHDFNNLLAVILGNTELLSDEIGDNALLDTVGRAATRGAELTRRLLAFARQQELSPQTVDLVELIGGVDELFRRTLGAPVDVRIEVPETTWPVLADPGQLENALLNLAINARDAMPESGTLTITCDNVHVAQDDPRFSKDVSTGDFVEITVRDTGVGMTEEVRERAFEPFFTTKDIGEGSGLGLSMVYGFVRQSGGDACILTSPGRGTQIKLFLPRSKATTAMKADAQDAKRAHGETILVLEDDPDVRAFAVSALKSLGYQVLEARDAAAAMQVLESGADRPDLLLSDVVLPGGVSGPELAAKAKDKYPDLKLVFMSGYAADLYTEDKIPGFDNILLSKPFRRAELADAIRRTLAR